MVVPCKKFNNVGAEEEEEEERVTSEGKERRPVKTRRSSPCTVIKRRVLAATPTAVFMVDNRGSMTTMDLGLMGVVGPVCELGMSVEGVGDEVAGTFVVDGEEEGFGTSTGKEEGELLVLEVPGVPEVPEDDDAEV